jgi:predicted transcriptional regulator
MILLEVTVMALESILLKDIMSQNVISVKKDTPLKELMELFLKNEISGVPVVDEDDVAIGIVSKSDIIRSEKEIGEKISKDVSNAEQPFGRIPEVGYSQFDVSFQEATYSTSRVANIMQPTVISLEEDDNILRAIDVMVTNRIHRICVNRKDGKIAGIISTFSILEAIAANDSSTLSHYIERC